MGVSCDIDRMTVKLLLALLEDEAWLDGYTFTMFGGPEDEVRLSALVIHDDTGETAATLELLQVRTDVVRLSVVDFNGGYLGCLNATVSDLFGLKLKQETRRGARGLSSHKEAVKALEAGKDREEVYRQWCKDYERETAQHPEWTASGGKELFRKSVLARVKTGNNS